MLLSTLQALIEKENEFMSQSKEIWKKIFSLDFKNEFITKSGENDFWRHIGKMKIANSICQFV